MPGVGGLSTCSVERDHDLTEQTPPGRQEISIRKRQDIGRPVVTQKVAVEHADSLIPGQKNVDFRHPDVDAFETGIDQTPKGFGRRSGRSSLPIELNAVHSVRSSD